MRNHRILTIVTLVISAVLSGAAADAQTDVAASVYGAFQESTSGNGIRQSPSNSAGALIELRHISNPILGFEATYSYNRNDQAYTSGPIFSNLCPVGVNPCSFNIQVPANAHEFSADWIPSIHFGNLRPFGVLGIGALVNQPTGYTANPSPAQSGTNGGVTQTSTRAVYIYGAGLDWGLLPHIGLRFQYRGNLYKAPDLTTLYSSTNAFTHTAEPMVGLYFRL